MPLHILAILVVVGLTVIIAAVHFSGGSREIAPLTADQATLRFKQDHQTFDLAECIVADDGRTAVVFSSDRKQGGLVLQMGDKLVTRKLDAPVFYGLAATQNGLQLSLRDFTLPKVSIALIKEEERSALAERLESLIEEAA